MDKLNFLELIDIELIEYLKFILKIDAIDKYFKEIHVILKLFVDDSCTR